jgi:sec-independent protein translocase protein TatC
VFFPLFYFSQELYTLVAQPLMQSLPAGTSMIATDVTSPFLVPFKLTLYVSILLAMPIILHQAWGFISPGLYKHEKRFALPLLASSIALFYGGVAFAYFVVFPVLFGFFTAIAPEGVAVMTDISRYLDFVITLFIAFGAAFELPIAILLMVWSGITTVESLREKRPYVVVGCFVVGMLLTPPDVISQTLLAVPMWLLFEAGVLVASMIKKREKQADPEAP